MPPRAARTPKAATAPKSKAGKKAAASKAKPVPAKAKAKATKATKATEPANTFPPCMALGDMNIRFDGKRALVTGAGKGIGRACVGALVACGADVIAVTRSQRDLDTLLAEYPGITTVQADLGDTDNIKTALADIGDVDLLVNNAGVGGLAPFMDTTLEDFDRIMNVNIRGILLISQICAKSMIDRGVPGSIVNVSSQASMAALDLHTAYCTSKGALDHMTRMMSLELGAKGIRSNCVNPTVVLTDLGRAAWDGPENAEKAGKMLGKIPMGRFAEVPEVVHPILFLLSDRSSMINGVMLPIDGGFLAG